MELSNIEIAPVKEDQRPLIVMNDVEDVDLFRIKAPKLAGVPAAVLENVRNFSVSASKPLLADTQMDKADNVKL